jgi:hypothetical protein
MTPRGPTTDPAERYSLLWSGGGPDLDAFLAQTGPLSPDELAAVLRVDQRERWQAGERVPAEMYLRHLPDPPDPEIALDLIYNEYLIRERIGERPAPDEFARRFPAHAGMLRDQLALHRAVEGDTHSDGPTRPSSAVEAEVLPRPFGPYTLLSVLGRGGMGTVYLADDARLGRQVALKVPRFDPARPAESAERFRREGRAAAAVCHPCLCPVFDIGQADGLDYFTMPHVPGETLAARLAREGPLPQREAARLVLRIAEGMEAAHRAGVVHRDLKPSNVLLDDRGDPVVTDFGLARRVGPDDPRMTASGAVIGTAAYLPPEQVGCAPEAVGPRSDVYSLGVILYELLAGRPPFAGTVGEVLVRVLSDEPEPLARLRPDLDPRLTAACHRAMAKNPARRFASMAEFAAALRPVTDGTPVPPDRRWAARLLAAVAAVALAGVGIWFATRPPIPTTPTAARPEPDPDPFRAGSVWAGTFQFLPAGDRGSVVLRVTTRSGDAFDATYETDAVHRWEATGRAVNGEVEWRLTKALTPQAEEAGAAGTAVVKGTYAAGAMDVMYEDHDSRAKMTLRRK